ncbi:MAG TPA: hypothetical protein VG165_15870 [Solirubrobacteraceae bacterium]|jgi:hypothetical protein|nr:hypothetical protein [Solirubrobacteraceae bacterium]
MLVGLTVWLAPGTASAATATPFNCDATALSVTLLTLAPITLGTANAGSTTCQNEDGTLLTIPASAGLPLTAGVLVAKTGVSSDGQTATAVGGVTGLGVGLGGSVLAQITGPISQTLTGSQTPITLSNPLISQLLTSLGLGGSTPTLTQGDLATGLSQLLQSVLSQVLDGSIAGIGVADSIATTKCVSGKAVLSGQSQLAGLQVLGNNIPLDPVVNQALNLLNTQQLDQVNLASTINELLTNLETSLGLQTLATGPLGSTVAQLETALDNLLNTTVQPLLTNLLTAAQPLINSIIDITVQPDLQVKTATQLSQTALHLNVTLLGTSILDLTLGQARVSQDSVQCVSPVTVASLQCTTRKLTLIDVLQRGNQTYVTGAAQSSLIGKKVGIYFTATGKLVGSATVAKSGLFHTYVPLPPASIRYTNSARYFAKSGQQSSLRLKFSRRMHILGLTSSGGKVRISGEVTQPLTVPVSKIVIQRRISCTKTVNVKTLTGNSAGRFSATLAAPPATQAGVYRAETFVRQNAHSSKPFPTFTLPGYVQIG